MGEAADRLTHGGGDSREAVERLDGEVEQLREELSRLVDELDRRREALDPRVQIRRHPLKGAVAGGFFGLMGGLAFAVVRRRHGRRSLAAERASTPSLPPDREREVREPALPFP